MLSAHDFSFDGELGSEGAEIWQLGENYFAIRLAASPPHDRPRWVNRLQFTIARNARGRPLRLEVSRPEAPAYWFNEYFLSYSSGGEEWRPITYDSGQRGLLSDTLVFEPFSADRVVVGNQVPMSAETASALCHTWAGHAHVSLHRIGQSLGGRDLLRVEIADPEGVDPADRWVHYVANHHPGEGNAQWRIAGLVGWLLGDDPVAADCRRRCTFHVVLMASPDSPSRGYSRCNLQGRDMNRDFRVDGSDANLQGHESFLWQRDFEALMASPAPVTAAWLMHTWGGQVEPFLLPGREIEGLCGWTHLREGLRAADTGGLCKPLALYGEAKARENPTHWNTGPWLRWGLTCGLIEGSGGLLHRSLHKRSGAAIGAALAGFYKGWRRRAERP